MVKTLKNIKKEKISPKLQALGKGESGIPSKTQKTKLEWANDIALNADLSQIQALL
ncbi:hypothetical protein VB796_09360 [Arcicella sp. LKC2W]|uniref:hypothetical protein n=1 Tax=Arcicella sp. LKC2W TaxID=2984198 RepID=UPI002B218F35|nr:hypothetical protein [Arcicella sp. LKC2W]MEA5459244.1 hypothetical protein [Arcicella sp. LKC2W]